MKLKPTTDARIDWIRSDISRLYGFLNSREAKYIRNYNRFLTNGARRDSIWNLYTLPLSYWGESSDGGDSGKEPDTTYNVIAMSIETKVSKLSTLKVRPYFDPVNGTFRTSKTAKAALEFFDAYYDDQDVYQKMSQAYRDACIFEYGCLHVDEESTNVSLVSPWEFFVDPAEFNFGKLSRCMWYRQSYPAVALPESAREHPDIIAMLEANPTVKAKYTVYYDLYNKRKFKFYNQILIEETELSSDRPPFLLIWYKDPIKGFFSTSMVDDLYTIQTQIDRLSKRVDAAVQKSPFNVIIIPDGGNVKESKLSNEAGIVLRWTPGQQTGQPIVSTPPAIDNQYISMIDFNMQKALNRAGISELSALSKKPGGNPSGVALQTLEDVESDRHNVDVMNYEKMLVNLARLCIDIFPDKLPVLPATINRDNSITWKDIKEQSSLLNIQYSSASSLSKDPSEKLKQVQELMKMQLIQPEQAASLLEQPDIQQAFSPATASYNYCRKIIERAIEDEAYDFYEVVNLDVLFKMTATMIMQLDANNEDPKIVRRLEALLKGVVSMQKAMPMLAGQAEEEQQAGVAAEQQKTAPVPAPVMPPTDAVTPPRGSVPVTGEGVPLV